MKSILPNEYKQDGKRTLCRFIGPGTQVILLTPTVSNVIVQPILQFPQRQGRCEDNIPEKFSTERETGILYENKGRCNDNIQEKLLTKGDTGILNEVLSSINLDRLKCFIASYIANPGILHLQKFTFYKDYLESLGVNIPENCDKRVLPSTAPINKSIDGSKSGEYKCTECDMVFITSYHLECHTKIHTDKKPYECSWCGSTYTAIGSLKSHMQAHAGERAYKCSQCDKTFNTKTYLLNHMRTMHIEEKPYKCLQCNKSFSVQLNLRNHIARHFGKKQYQCNQCGKVFSYKQHLISHMLIHTGERPYMCSQCGNSFSQHSRLKQHMRIHTMERPYKCNQCEKSFKHKIVFINHIKMIHNGEKPYKCVYCDKSYFTNSSLINHMAVHTGVDPNVSEQDIQSFAEIIGTHECSQCGETFTTKKSLKKHIRYNHIGGRQFLCTKCDRVFLSKGNLIEHMRIHTGERPYECNQCGNSFTSSDKLKEHIMAHIEERPYISNQCENNSEFNSFLYQHIGTHRDYTEVSNDTIIFPEPIIDIKEEFDDNCINYNITQSEMNNSQMAIEETENVLKIKEEIEVKQELLEGQYASTNLLCLMQPSG